ncbi:hypothetical protein ABLU56_03070 [Klebsiella sp. GN_Kp186]|nr:MULTISPECIES: hypothetical protein [Klebsiella]
MKLVEFDANKYPIIVLHGRKVVDGLEWIKGRIQKKKVGKWLGGKYAMLL